MKIAVIQTSIGTAVFIIVATMGYVIYNVTQNFDRVNNKCLAGGGILVRTYDYGTLCLDPKLLVKVN